MPAVRGSCYAQSGQDTNSEPVVQCAGSAPRSTHANRFGFDMSVVLCALSRLNEQRYISQTCCTIRSSISAIAISRPASDRLSTKNGGRPSAAAR